MVRFEQQVFEPTSNFTTTGYWENYAVPIVPGEGKNSDASYYEHDLRPIDNVFYSFLTLDAHPNATEPRELNWNGTCLHDTMTLNCI